ncbi:4Fe-4S binding protein [Mitsuaria sp. WAJ17]|uniref:4Fe-4S binding protein n=1 Tax=Mitsuaria sp. WAJ17 TaxID=2761452 RepID=UPI00210827BA|nr:4Fe-4S binding protein [Mitsuaria sp. WAJ17]
MSRRLIPIAVSPAAQPPAGIDGVARWGEALRRHRGWVLCLQWAVVLLYLTLVILPVLLPPPPESARLLDHLTLFAQFLFWGIWWPFVILSVMLSGRLWCGTLCPEGTLTEWASRHGLGRSIPRWLRWGGWPLLAFVWTTVWGQLISVYEYPRATLLILGGSTVLAMGVGWVYGRGKRVWCRYLCPVSGVFGLLARLAPLHYRADAAAWRAHAGPAQRVDCPPLLDLRHLDAAADCHACGRCSGHRQAIALRGRWPGAELLQSARDPQARLQAALLLVYGLFGVALAAFQWSGSPLWVALKQAAVDAVLEGGLGLWLLEDTAPWWLLTHEPQAQDVFLWIDGLCILVYIGTATVLVGGLLHLLLRIAARCSGLDWAQLALTMTPLGAMTLFVGLSQMTLSQLRTVGLAWPSFVLAARLGLLGAATLWSLAIAGMNLKRAPGQAAGRWLAGLLLLTCLLLMDGLWWRHFVHA